MTEDAYFKDFIDIPDEDPSIAEKLNIINIISIRKSAKCTIAKTQINGYRMKQIIGMTPIDKEDDPEFRKLWAENIIGFLRSFAVAYLFEDLDTVKQNSEIMKNIFSDIENYENGETILIINWNNWNED
jgi:hypothetical protein